jgi:NADPH:quinone reductase-like Zn-dependent oxidoreductase
MRALWLTGHRGPESFEVRDSPDPTPAAGQVRIRVRAAGLNFADLLASCGLYPDAPRTPCVLGYEAAGIVDAVGEGVGGGLIGRRVMAMIKFGAHADTLCLGAQQIVPIPDTMTFEEAAAIPVNYLTAYHMLHRIASLRPGESVLIHQAAGGVGTAVLQLCRNVGGVTTFGTASRAKLDALRANGCTYPIDYRTADYAQEVRRLTGGSGVDIVLDALGGADWRRGYDLLKPCGRLVCFGFANLMSGSKRNMLHVLRQILRVPKFSPMKLLSDNRTVAGVNMGHLFGETAMLAEEMRAIGELYEAGVVKPLLDLVVPFSEAGVGLRRLQEAKNVGKVVLVP